MKKLIKRFQNLSDPITYDTYLPEIVVTPNSPLHFSGHTYSEAWNLDLKDQYYSGLNVRDARSAAVPYLMEALTLPWTLEGAIAAPSMIKSIGSMVRHPMLTGRAIKAAITPLWVKNKAFDKFMAKVRNGEYKLELPYDKKYDIDKILRKPKLDTNYQNFLEYKEELRIKALTNRVENGYATEAAPYQSTYDIKYQIIPRRLQSFKLTQQTNGVDKVKQLLKDHGLHDLNPSNALDLQFLSQFGNLSEEELLDWANYRQYAYDLNDYATREISLVDNNDWNELFPSEKMVRGDFDQSTDQIRIRTYPEFKEPIDDEVVTHEMRHWMDKHMPLTDSEKEILEDAYESLTPPASNTERFVPEAEFVTTNQDFRASVFRKKPSELIKTLDLLNKIIQDLTDDQVFDHLDSSNDYGARMYLTYLEYCDNIARNGKALGWSEQHILDRINAMKSRYANLIKRAATSVGVGTGAVLSIPKRK